MTTPEPHPTIPGQTSMPILTTVAYSHSTRLLHTLELTPDDDDTLVIAVHRGSRVLSLDIDRAAARGIGQVLTDWATQ